MKFLTKEVKIGLAGIVAIAILFWGINFLKGINMFKPGTGYYVEFENVCGLTPSSPVYADGFQIGIVRNITYNYAHPGHVVVEIEVDNDMRIPKGSRAELVTEMLGTVKMNLLLPRNEQRMCQLGDTIYGSVNEGIMGVAAGLVPKVETMLPKLDSILGSLNNLLADQTLSNTLHNTEQITANLQVTTRELNSLLQKDIPAITGNLNTVTANFAVISHNLKGIDYAATIAKVNATLDDVKMFTEKLQSKDNTLGLLLNDPSIYNNLNATTANAAELLKDLREHPKRYVHFSLFGKKE